VAQQGSPPRRSLRAPDAGRRGLDRAPRQDRPRRADRPGRPVGWQELDAFGPDAESDLPPWAGPGVYPVGPGGTGPGGTRARTAAHGDAGDDGYEAAAQPADDGARPRRRAGRAAAARLRKSRRRVLWWCGTAIAACVLAGVIVTLSAGKQQAPQVSWVTTLQPGEFKTVPDTCTAISPGVLDEYLPSAGRKQLQPSNTSTDSECAFTVDHAPVFLVLEVTAQAYEPFAGASGNGSASAYAADNFALDRQGLAVPAKKSPLPPAQVTALPQAGQQAFTAIQREHVAGMVTYVATVDILERNVVVSVSLSGQDAGHGYGPVSMTTLQAGAQAVARSVLATVLTEPKA
jgi:hypothetical protein